MSIDNQYQSGEYWEKNPTFHEEDAEFKVANAVAVLKRNGIVPKDILDVGTGSGKNAYLLSEHYDVPAIGLDHSPKAIEHARTKYPGSSLSFQVTDIKDYTKVAHVGFMFDVIEHVEDYMGFLKSASAKSEYWVLNIPLEMHAQGIVRGAYMTSRNKVGHLHYFSKASAIATLEECGFEVLEAEFANVVMHELKTHFTLKGLIAALPRLTMFKFNRSLAVSLLGGASLIVLCKAR